MRRTLVWDLPTRLFHGLFAGGFIAAAVIALGQSDDSPLFPYHGIIGLALGLPLIQDGFRQTRRACVEPDERGRP